MVVKDPTPTRPKGVAVKAADDLALVRGISSAASSESAKQFERHMQVAKRVMRENRSILRELAK